MGKSGWQRRQDRVAQGLPRYTEGEVTGRRAAIARRNIARRIANFEWLNAQKLEHGCVDCGYRDHPAALEFDHLPGLEKRRNIAAMMYFSRRAILAEIAKCELVCANCHRVRTANRHAKAAANRETAA